MNGGDASEAKDPAIKLFGKTIPVPESHAPAKSDQKSDMGLLIPYKSEAMFQNVCNEITTTEGMDDNLEASGNQYQSSVAKNDKEEDSQITGDRNEGQAISRRKEESAETSCIETEKVLKRPDRILVCPRCNSLDTKFCYFNNYNVNQPRHFCKNCHRYWTAGGTVRNVPVGAGRRKNKHLTSQYCQALASPDVVLDSTNQRMFSAGESRTTLRPSNGTVLNLPSEGHLCESTGERREEMSLHGSSISVFNVQENDNQITQEQEQGNQSNSLQCYPVPPWVFAWNQGWNSGTSMVAAQCPSELVSVPDDHKPNPIQWCSTPMLPVPPGVPLQFVPASYWSCFPVWNSGTGHSLTLGKHSRDGNSTNEEKSANCVLGPKTQRIEDPDVASKSSIWPTLASNSNHKETESRCSIFTPYKSSAEYKGHISDTTEVLQANPAALSRCHTFQEST